MATIGEWQSAETIRRIQNKNYVGLAYETFWKNWKLFNGGYATNYRTVAYGSVIDNSVRIPAWISPYSGYSWATVWTTYYPQPEYYSNMFSMSRFQNYYSGIFPNGLRMFVRLKPLKDFIAQYAANKQYWVTNYKFFFNGSPGGMLYSPFNPDGLGAIIDYYYVLENYAIYSNNPPEQGNQIQHQGESNWNGDYRANMNDTYIPVRLSDGNLAYIPYMYQFMPVRHNSFYTYGAQLIGEAGGIGKYDGKGFSGVNHIMSTGAGNFVTNPGTPDAKYISGMDALTELPEGQYLQFCVADKKTWEDIFDGSGMLWSYNLDDVVSPSGDNLNKPLYPGQPDNPTGGGEGDGDNLSDDIPLPDVKFYPNANAYNRYWIKPSQLIDVQKWIFSESFFNNVGRLWNDPAEYLINLTFYPFNGELHDVNNTQPNTMLSIGNLTSEIPVTAMLDGYNAVFEGGTFDVKEYYGTYLDYAPYTTAEIYIPYIGYRNLNINDIMGKSLHLRYVVDFDTNLLTATLLADDKPLTMYSGSFGVKIAISGTNANQVAETVTKMAFSTVTSVAGIVGSAAGGNASGAISGGAGAVSNLLNTTMDIQYSPRYFGNPTPSTGLYNTQIPHLIIHRPITAEPKDYAALSGYSAGYSGIVSGFSGFLKCSAVKLLADTTMSAAEQQAATNLLLGGVYI